MSKDKKPAAMGKGTATESAEKGKVSIRTGLQRDYLEGLDNLRKVITDLEVEVDTLKREFYCCDKNQEELYESYLKKCNDKLLHCNNKLKRNNVKLVPLDSEMKLVEMLNKIRELDRVDPNAVTLLTEFWENLKDTLGKIQALSHKYQTKVLKRLNSSCVSYQNGLVTMKLTQNYTDDVLKYQGTITQFLRSIDSLCKTFPNKISQELFTNTNFSDRILVSCDRKAFPILRLVPDLSEKLVHVCSLARQWIDKDEIYVHDINNHIREARRASEKAEADLRDGKVKQTEMSKSVSEAQKIFKSNKEKLAKLDAELQVLDQQLAQYSTMKSYKSDEFRQKTGMVGFLEISISQTKKNTTLQLKRSRLMRQLRELEESLVDIERELSSIQKEVESKSSEKEVLDKEVEVSSKSYKTLKSDLDKFTQNLTKLEKEVCELTDSLSHLETIQTFKTSPEKVEDFYDRPSTVKLAPSLQEKIRMRKRRMMNLDKSDAKTERSSSKMERSSSKMERSSSKMERSSSKLDKSSAKVDRPTTRKGDKPSGKTVKNSAKGVKTSARAGKTNAKVERSNTKVMSRATSKINKAEA